jgi:hypothetical protein
MLALACCSAAARCEVSVQGTAAAVRVDAREAPLSEVLGALEASFKVRHDSLIALDAITIAGAYSGTLEEVLRRLLTGLNYLLKTEGDMVEVIIVGRPGHAPAPYISREPATPANSNPAAQWRSPPKR